MLPYMDKSKLFLILRALYKEQDQNAQDQEDCSVLIIDACPRASRNESFETCLELSAAVMASMTKFISRYITVHLVFDQYNTTTSLQQTARERYKSTGSTGTCRTSYACEDSTPIRMYLKVFLSESKLVSLYTFLKKHSIISQNSCSGPIYPRCVITNKTYTNVSHMCTSQEAADTILMLHAIGVVSQMKMQQSTFCQRTLMF